MQPNEFMPNILVYHLHQDDPRKCTSSKMLRMRMASLISPRAIRPRSLVLNPSSEDILLASDRINTIQFGLVVIDCSWKQSSPVFLRRFRGINKRLPILLAGNPVNYGHPFKLSSVEAVAGSLFLMHFEEQAKRILSKFKWGMTFLTLNELPLKDYSLATSEAEILSVEHQYFPQIYPS